jgi:type II secretion system (T2SS) protein G
MTMTPILSRLAAAAVGLSLGAAIGGGVEALARELGSKDARDAIAKLLGRSPDAIRIKDVSPGLVGGDATVTAQVDVAFQLHQDKDGSWRVASVRLAGGRWEDVEMLRRALDADKTAQARSDLAALAVGVEGYRRERGFYPEAETEAALVDEITPRFQPKAIRIDPWNQPYYYHLTAAGYRLGSPGPDGKPDTGDDVVYGEGGGSR